MEKGDAQLLKNGKVYIAGAGPGNPDLITVRLANVLKKADVILTDRLVNPLIIELYANPNALVLVTGKQGYEAGSMPQWEINELLIREVSRGLNVVRLKGGDISIFSNLAAELETLVKHQARFELIPGITAASGAAAFAGIPLTARGYSEGVQFLSFHPNSIYSPDKWKRLAMSSDTLIFYMATKNLFSLAEILLRYSRKPQLPLAVIEQATTEYQKVHISTLRNCQIDFADFQFGSPSLVIIGEVVSLYHTFQWLEEGEDGSVFQQLAIHN